MKLIPTIAACSATLALSGLAFAGPGEDIIAKEKCGSCHTATTTKKAPSLASVATEVQGRRGRRRQDRQHAQDRRRGGPQEDRRERRRPEGGRRRRSRVQVAPMANAKPPGAIRRALRWLFSPSARWSVFALLAGRAPDRRRDGHRHAGRRGRDGHRPVLRHDLPLAREVRLSRASADRALQQPDRRAGDVRRLPRPAQLPGQADRQGGKGHRRRLCRDARHDLHPGEVRPRALASRQQGVGRDARGQLRELPSLPRPAGDGQREAVGRRGQAAQEVRLRQGHVHRLPHRRRAQGARGAAAAGEGRLRAHD